MSEKGVNHVNVLYHWYPWGGGGGLTQSRSNMLVALMAMLYAIVQVIQ